MDRISKKMATSARQGTPFVPRTLALSRPVYRNKSAAFLSECSLPPLSQAATETTQSPPPQEQQQQQHGPSTVRMLPCDTGGAHVSVTMDVYMSAFAGRAFTYWWPRGDLTAMRTWQEQRALNRCRDVRSVQFMAVLDHHGGVADVREEEEEEEEAGGRGVPAHEDVVAYSKWTLPSPSTEVGKRQFDGLRRDLVGVDDSEEISSTLPVQTQDSGIGENLKDNKPKDHPPDIPAGANRAYYNEFFEGMEKISKKWKSDEMLELSLMATRPAYHGHGIAGAMIRPVLEVADRHGVRALLLGLELATPLYRRLGFETVETFSFELAKKEAGEDGVMHVMIREPKGQ